MKTMTHISLFFLLSTCVFSTAIDLNPPTWRGNNYTTHQQWHFETIDLEPYADIWNNPFGQTQIKLDHLTAIEYDEFTASWKWTLNNGEPADIPLMQIEVEPNWSNTATSKKAWVQITWGVNFQGVVPPYDKADMIYLSGFNSFDGIFPTLPLDAGDLGNDGSVEWYHTTFQIPFVSVYLEEDEFGNTWTVEENAPWGDLFLFPYFPVFNEPLSGEYDIYVAGIIVDTICVPEPVSIILMGLGILFIIPTKFIPCRK